MIRQVTTLVVFGVVGSMVMVGNAEACHKKRCGCAPTVCAAPMPAPCVTYAAPCAPKVKHCAFKLPTFCHKKAACAPVVASCAPTYAAYPSATPVSYGAPMSYPTAGYPIATPQASMQH
jgi:hypothetical protein